MAKAMSDLDKIKRQYEDSLTCALCMEIFTSPKMLECSHTYCEKCAQKLMDNEGGNTSFRCPECREPCPIPADGAKGLKGSSVINSLIDIVGDFLKAEGKPTPLFCGLCKSKGRQSQCKAISKCIQCDYNLCKKCVSLHQMFKPMESHKLIDLSGNMLRDIQDALKMLPQRTVYCKSHPTKPVEYYCKTDETSLCQMCYVIGHAGHPCEDISQTANKSIPDFDKTIQTGKLYVKHCDKGIAEFSQHIKRLDEEKDKCKQKVDELLETSIDELHRSHAKIVKELEKVHAKNTKILTSLLDDMSMYKGIADSKLRHYNTIKLHGTPVEVLSTISELKKQAVDWLKPPHITMECKNHIKFQPDKGLQRSLSLGRMSLEPEVHSAGVDQNQNRVSPCRAGDSDVSKTRSERQSNRPLQSKNWKIKSVKEGLEDAQNCQNWEEDYKEFLNKESKILNKLQWILMEGGANAAGVPVYLWEDGTIYVYIQDVLQISQDMKDITVNDVQDAIDGDVKRHFTWELHNKKRMAVWSII